MVMVGEACDRLAPHRSDDDEEGNVVSDLEGAPPSPSLTDRARNVETVWRFYRSGPADDDSGRVSMFARDAVWHVPGENPVAGDYRGVDAITQVIVSRMQPLTRWEIEPHAVMANRDLVMASVRLRGERYGRAIACRGGHVFRFDPEGRIVEAWGFVDDQARLDEILAATGI
jgi:ketosteroid isomerase-like protein